MPAVFNKRCGGLCGRRRYKGSPHYYVDKRTGLPRSICKFCTADDGKRWRQNNPGAHRQGWKRRNHKANLKRRFGLTEIEFDVLEKEYGKACSICGNPETRNRRLSLDHDHVTRRIRGFLCCKCNLLLGNAGDNPDLLLRAAVYLRKPPIKQAVR